MKWTALVANLRQRNYDEASKELDVIQDYDDLQDALQVIPFKALNQDLPASLSILEKLYTRFISLTNKEEGRLIIRHVFKVDVLLKNIIRLHIEDQIFGRTIGRDLNKDSVDQITQITWNLDCGIVQDLMSQLTRLKSTLKHYRKNMPKLAISGDSAYASTDIETDLKRCLTKFNLVIQYLETLTKGGMAMDNRGYITDPSASRIDGDSCGDSVERIRRRCSFNQVVLDVLEPCKGNLERWPLLLQNLRELVQNDTKFLEVMTELFVGIPSSSYAGTNLEKLLRHSIGAYRNVLAAVAASHAVDEPAVAGGQLSVGKPREKDNGLVNNGLKIDVNGSPFRSRFDARRFSGPDTRERKEPLRSQSYRELRSGDFLQVRDSFNESREVSRLKEKLAVREQQLEETRSFVTNLKKREEELLEKLTEQAKTRLINSEKFENISGDSPRVDHLVKQYDDLYSQLRLEALDDLDNIAAFDALERSDEIKSQITFAIMTVSFHLTGREIDNRREKICCLLNVDFDCIKNDECSSLRNEISLQLRKSASTVDLQHVVNEAFNGLCSTMFDFPELKSCDYLRRFVEACVRFSWSICTHVPPLTVNYEPTNFVSPVHTRSHNSNERRDAVMYYVWPALVEKETKTVLYKGVVTT